MSAGNISQQIYCASRFCSVRRVAREVKIGAVTIGGKQPIAVQSMTTTPTQDIAATLKQSIALAEAGCQIVRITAQNLKAAEALGAIRKQFSAAGFKDIPLVADIHFLPQTAMEAAKHVDKVRINPGNYADKKKFQIREYSDNQYQEELERLHEAFSPIVLRCRDYGRAMRIGTNHGSLSDRVMNRYGDTPLGMVESALEFIRIAESHQFHDIVISMKASNPKVMIQAYRLMAARMDEAGMAYPLHLGVTEAGDGDDARIKSAIGIGSLLYDGLGDTIRVSLTEDPVAEIPVAISLARKAEKLWQTEATRTLPDPIDPFSFERRPVNELFVGQNIRISPLDAPTVITPLPAGEIERWQKGDFNSLPAWQKQLKDARIEGLLIPLNILTGIGENRSLIRNYLSTHSAFRVWDTGTTEFDPSTIADWHDLIGVGDILLARCETEKSFHMLPSLLQWAHAKKLSAALDIDPQLLAEHGNNHLPTLDGIAIFTLSRADKGPVHPLGRWRQLSEVLQILGQKKPLWIRNTRNVQATPEHPGFGDQLLESSILSGSLLADGIGDLISIECVDDPVLATNLAYNILQGARARVVKTEYVACPSCGRTLFDLQSTTQKIRNATGHLKGVTIAVMGCIVNGPGEMADADFGYVGGAPGKINLYVGKECVQLHIPAEKAVDALIDLIRQHGKWQEPPVES